MQGSLALTNPLPATPNHVSATTCNMELATELLQAISGSSGASLLVSEASGSIMLFLDVYLQPQRFMLPVGSFAPIVGCFKYEVVCCA